MTQTVGRLRATSIALVLAAAAIAGAAGGQPPGVTPEPSAAASHRPVELPDLRRMHPSVQAQLREAYAALESALAAGDRSRIGADGADARAEAYGRLGTLLLGGDYAEAAGRCFQQAHRLAPRAFRWPYYLAQVAMRRGDLEQAVAHFERARTIRPTDHATLIWLAHALIDLGRPEAAEAVLAEARAHGPETQALAFQDGRAALVVRDYARAVDRLERALRLNPAASIIHYPLAMAYRGLGDLERARHHLRESGSRSGAGAAAGAAVMMPDPLMAEVHTGLRGPQTYRDLGLQASERGDWAEAVRQFREAVGLSPDNSTLRLNLGLALIQAGDAPAALRELEQAVEFDPGLAHAHYAIGTLFGRSGRDADAIARYRAATTQDPHLEAAQLRLGDALRRTGQLDAALAAYGQVADSRAARFGEAMALVRLGRDAEAAATLRAATVRYPEEVSFSHALARLLAAAPDDGVRDGRRALEMARGLAETHQTAAVAETMAMALAEVGQFTDAMEWQRFAMTIAADAGRPDVAARMSLNLARYQRGEPCRMPWHPADPEHRPGPSIDPTLLDPAP